MPQKILLIDGFSILNRAYYALPLLSTKEGEYTNAVYGFMNMFFRFMEEEKPDYITVAFDVPQPTFRHEKYGAYKGTRKGMPDELRAQVPMLKTLLEKMQINTAECPGFEADDVIGTLAAKATDAGIEPVIISGDRDLLQLATDTVKIRLPKTKAGKTEVEDYLAADVLAKYGVSPQAFIDVKALMGDASDNVPGVPGIGEVTATKIIAAYGSLDNAIENVDTLKPPKAAENLIEFKEQAYLSRMLVTIVTDAPVELNLVPQGDMFNAEAKTEVQRLELKTLYKRFTSADEPVKQRKLIFETTQDASKAKEIFAKLTDSTELSAVCFVWDETELTGIAVASNDITPTYIAADTGEISLFTQLGLTPAELVSIAKPWLESANPKCIFDAKNEAQHFNKLVDLYKGKILDIMLAAYVLDALSPNNSPSDIAHIYLQEELPTLDDVLENKGKRSKDRRTAKDIPIETMAKYATAAADVLLRAYPLIEEAIAANEQADLYQNIELPVAQALFSMEFAGIKVDPTTLINYGIPLNEQLQQLTTAICELAGEEFNINSPAQLGVVLFEKLGLKGGKKNTQGYSTAAEVLEKIKDTHDIIPLVLEYRAYAKLKSTYVDGLLPLINPVTKRIHSTFKQSLTATGRLSSTEPNLQNIPVRMPLGRELRKAFVPKEGCVFIGADYSQIELRLLAHMSEDETLINAFKDNQDIHALTASQVFGVLPEDVTVLQRSNAKAVNFGIVYGMGAFGLSEDLKISVKEAEDYIAGYFNKYPGVKVYMDKTIENAKKDGYVATMYNRRRAMPELRSSNFNVRSFGERVAMNMPLQGSAADIIKIAMVNVSRRLQKENMQAQLILQIHDELLLEVPTTEIDKASEILKQEMENVATLKVPLVVDVNVGNSWYDTK